MKENSEYNGVKVSVGNLQEFHIMFMEHQYKLWYYDIERLKAKREGDIKAIEDLNEQQTPIVEELKSLYKIEWYLRHQLWDKYESNFKDAIDQKAAEDPVWWINNFAWTHDPRLANLGLPAKIPMVLYPRVRQIYFACIREKCRPP